MKFQRRVYIEMQKAVYDQLIAGINAGQVDPKQFYAHRIWEAMNPEVQRKSIDETKIILEIPIADFYTTDDPDYNSQDSGLILENMKQNGYIIEWYVHPMDGEIPFVSPEGNTICDRNILDLIATPDYQPPEEVV